MTQVPQVTYFLDFLGHLNQALVDLEAEVSHQHLVEELGEERHLERVLLVVVGPVVEQHAQRHARAVELAALGRAGGVHQHGRPACQRVATLAHRALSLVATLLLVILATNTHQHVMTSQQQHETQDMHVK